MRSQPDRSLGATFNRDTAKGDKRLTSWNAKFKELINPKLKLCEYYGH